jgi:hypothetical protein
MGSANAAIEELAMISVVAAMRSKFFMVILLRQGSGRPAGAPIAAETRSFQ